MLFYLKTLAVCAFYPLENRTLMILAGTNNAHLECILQRQITRTRGNTLPETLVRGCHSISPSHASKQMVS